MPKYKWTKTKSPGIYEYEITKEKKYAVRSTYIDNKGNKEKLASLDLRRFQPLIPFKPELKMIF